MGNLEYAHAYLWNDNQIVLRWLTSEKKHPIFIKNRVREIKELTDTYKWRYCPTKSNPADILSRGLIFDKFKDSRLWMHRPEWLKNDGQWPVWNALEIGNSSAVATEEPKTTEITESHINVEIESTGITRLIDIQRFSRYQKLLRVTVYVLRFISNCRNQRKVSSLTTREIGSAAVEWIRSAQQSHYADITTYLQTAPAKKTNLIRHLNLYIDENKLLRCRGRIHNTPLDADAGFSGTPDSASRTLVFGLGLLFFFRIC